MISEIILRFDEDSPEKRKSASGEENHDRHSTSSLQHQNRHDQNGGKFNHCKKKRFKKISIQQTYEVAINNIWFVESITAAFKFYLLSLIFYLLHFTEIIAFRDDSCETRNEPFPIEKYAKSEAPKSLLLRVRP